LRNISEDPTKIGIQHTYYQVYSNMQGTPAHIQTPTHWNRSQHGRPTACVVAQ